jgi:hypothetical protein
MVRIPPWKLHVLAEILLPSSSLNSASDYRIPNEHTHHSGVRAGTARFPALTSAWLCSNVTRTITTPETARDRIKHRSGKTTAVAAGQKSSRNAISKPSRQSTTLSRTISRSLRSMSQRPSSGGCNSSHSRNELPSSILPRDTQPRR